MSNPKVPEQMLKDAGVDTDRLVVVTAIGVETVIGEYDPDGLDPYGPASGIHGKALVNRVITLRNPKKLMTLKMQTPDGLMVNTVIGPLDIIEGGRISLVPAVAYTMADCSDATKENIFSLYAQHIMELRKNKAMAAGIHLPERPMPPGGPTRLALR